MRKPLTETHPDLAKSWDMERNEPLAPNEVTAGSCKKVWWICPNGHEWKATVYDRTRADGPTGCPVCSNRTVLAGFNDLATTNPALAAEWHPTRNGTLTPRDVVAGTNRLLWWKCGECGHEWRATGANRYKHGTGCPACSPYTSTPGDRSLAALFPDVAADWHPTRNVGASPETTTASSSRKVWWICPNGHEWKASVGDRTRADGPTGCPVCSNRTVLAGYNDLATTNPALAAEWHPTRNGSLTPLDVVEGSARDVWWKCGECGHEWRTHLQRRSLGSGCPKCASGLSSSFPEQALSFYLERLLLGTEYRVWPNIEFRPPSLGGAGHPHVLDMLVENGERGIGVEYDGERWHTDLSRDIRKDRLCGEVLDALVRVRESGCPEYPDGYNPGFPFWVIVRESSWTPSSLDEAVGRVIRLLGAWTGVDWKGNIDTRRDADAIRARLRGRGARKPVHAG